MYFLKNLHAGGCKNNFVFVELLRERHHLDRYTFHKIKYCSISVTFDMDTSVAEEIFILILNVRNYHVHQFKHGNTLTTCKDNKQLCGYHFQLIIDNTF